jgi:DNA-binding CsgD family transcriptional regulator
MHDFRVITSLLSKIAILSDSLDQKRRMLITGLAELVEADGWIWTTGRVDPVSQSPMQTNMLFGGLTDHQLAALLDSPSDTKNPSPCDRPLAALVAKGSHFVRTRQQLIDDETWYVNANTKTYFLDHGIDHHMYAITPFKEPGFSGIGFFRHTERPPFSEQQRQVVHMVTSEVQWLSENTLPEEHGTAVEQLTPRLRSVLPLLLDGCLCKEIAKLLHLSPHTIKGYIRDIYRHFDVNTQIGLIRHFRETK